MSLSVKIKALRTKNNKSLQDVADEVGASKAHIWDLETGKSRNPSMELVIKLATCFKTSVAELIGETPDENDGPTAAVAMYRDLKELSDADLETIKIMVDRLKIVRQTDK